MVKYIISAADIHIKNLRRQEEYQELLNKFIEQCKEFVNKHNSDEVRIVLAGDILHNKLDISCEAYALCSWFFKQLDSIAKTIVILGNHDANLQNTTRLDPLSLIFSLNKFKQTYFLDKELNYESGVIEDDNIKIFSLELFGLPINACTILLQYFAMLYNKLTSSGKCLLHQHYAASYNIFYHKHNP